MKERDILWGQKHTLVVWSVLHNFRWSRPRTLRIYAPGLQHHRIVVMLSDS